MSKTTILADSFKHIIKSAEEKVDNLREEYYDKGKKEYENNLHYWEGKLDGIKFAVSFEDDFFLLNIAELLNLNGHKEAAKYINSLVER